MYDIMLKKITLFILYSQAMFSPALIEKHIMGGAGVHIKDFDSIPPPLQRNIITKGTGSPYPLSMLGRTLPWKRVRINPGLTFTRETHGHLHTGYYYFSVI